MLQGYKGLFVWNKSYKLILNIYDKTKQYPKEEIYGLVSQMRRASISITANIAEGHGKNYLKEYIKFVSIAIGSCNELGVYLTLSRDLHYLNKPDYNELQSCHEEVSKMLISLRKSLENKKIKKN